MKRHRYIGILRWMFLFVMVIGAGAAHAQTQAGKFLLRYTETTLFSDYGIPDSIVGKMTALSPETAQRFSVVYQPIFEERSTSEFKIQLVFNDDSFVGYVADDATSFEAQSPVFVLPVTWVCTTHKHHSRQHSAAYSALKEISSHAGCTGWHLQTEGSIFSSALLHL